jgi:hypothetical protein
MKEEHALDKGAREEFEYFIKKVEMGAKKIAGPRTPENVRQCFHCKVWRRIDKLIKDMAELGNIKLIDVKQEKVE